MTLREGRGIQMTLIKDVLAVTAPLIGSSRVVRDRKLSNCRDHGDYEIFLVKTKSMLVPEWLGKCPGCESARKRRRFTEYVMTGKNKTIRAVLGEPWFERHEDCDLENFKHTADDLGWFGYSEQEITDIARTYKIVMRFATKFEEMLKATRWMFWVGYPGTGKDHLAVGIYRALLIHDYKIHLMNMEQLLGCKWAIVRKDLRMTEKALIELIGSLDLLIINELGLREYNGPEQAFIQEVLDHMYKRGRSVILIGNLQFEGEGVTVRSVLGDRIISRAAECDYWMLSFNWRDYRVMSKNAGKLNI